MSTGSKPAGTSGSVLAPQADPQPAPAAKRRSGGSRWSEILESQALLGITVAMIIGFAILPATTETFPTVDNLQLVLADQAVGLCLALAVLMPIVSGVWDFSPGATMGMSSIFAASVVSSSGSIPLAIAVAVAIGMAVGVVNGILVTKFRIHSVIATLGMTVIIAGVVQLKTEGQSIVNGIPKGLTDFGRSEFLEVPLVTIVALVVALAIYYLLTQTPYGRYLYSVGSKRAAARLIGLPVGGLTLSTFVVGGLISGIAGVLLLTRSGAGNPAIGPELTLPAFAAVFLGAVAIRPGRWNVGGVLVAIAFLAVLNDGLQLAGANTYVNQFANGAALLIGVGIANFVGRRRGREIEMQ